MPFLLVDARLPHNLPLLLDEVTTRFEEVTRLQNHRLGLGDDVEEQHSGTRVRLAIGDTAQLLLGRLRQTLEELVTHSQHLVYCREVVGGEHIYNA